MHPSTPYASHGCSEISVEISGISERSRKVGYFLTRSRYTCMCLPACRIIHTGVYSTFSPRAALPRRRGPNQVEAAPGENVLAGMVAEARVRLRSPPASPGRLALRRLLDATEWPFDAARSGYMA